MRKYLPCILLACLIILLAGCDSTFAFSPANESVTLTYNGSEYASVSQDECEYKYDSKDMVHLCSLNKGEWLGEAYNVYRHKDDKQTTYLFVIPEPSIRDVIAYAFVLKIKE